jgi:hypothetical protein
MRAHHDQVASALLGHPKDFLNRVSLLQAVLHGKLGVARWNPRQLVTDFLPAIFLGLRGNGRRSAERRQGRLEDMKDD